MATPNTATGLPNIEEDDIIHNRLLNDERAIRRLTRKFHAYSTKARPVPYNASLSTSISDLRDAFLSELAQYQIFLRKTTLQCQAEQRQVLAYLQERDRIADLHERYREDILTLKQELANAQSGREQKIAYDKEAAQINVLPARSELEESISSLEEEIAALQHDKEVQMSLMNARRDKFDQLINDINELRWMGREGGAEDPGSPTGEEEAVLGEDADGEPDLARTQGLLNPNAVPFVPGMHPNTSPLLPSPDIDMGRGHVELEEGEEEGAVHEESAKKDKPTKAKEDLEEGEERDSDESSLTELSEV